MKKKHRLGKFLLVLLSIIIVLSGAIALTINLIISPESLTRKTNRLLKEYISTEAHVGRVEITFFSTFPRFSAKVDSLFIAQPQDSTATLFSASRCVLAFNPVTILRDKEVNIRRLAIRKPVINILIDSTSNPLDILKLVEEENVETDNTESDLSWLGEYSFNLHKLIIDSASVDVSDHTRDATVKINNWSTTVGASFSERSIMLDLKNNFNGIFAEEQGVKWVNNTNVSIKTEAEFNRDSLILSFKKALLKVNNITLKAGGELRAEPLARRVAVNVKANLNTPSLADVLQLLPDTYIDQSDVTTSGNVNLNLVVSGYYGKDELPVVNTKILVKEAKAAYKDKPVTVDNIDCDADVLIDLNNKELSYAKVNSFNIKSSKILDLNFNGQIDNILVDPYVDANINSFINFGRLAEIFPLADDMLLRGLNNSSFALRFKLLDLEEGNYAKVFAEGESTFNKVLIAINADTLSRDTTRGSLFVNIPSGELLFGDQAKEKILLHQQQKLEKQKQQSKDTTQNQETTAKKRQAPRGNNTSLITAINFSDLGVMTNAGESLVLNNLQFYAEANIDTDSLTINGMRCELIADSLAVNLYDEAGLNLHNSDINLTIIPKNKRSDTRISAEIKASRINLTEQYNNSTLKLRTVNMSVKGVRQDVRQWDMNGKVGFSGFDMYSELFPTNVTIPNTSIAFDNRLIELNKASVNIGSSVFEATGQIENLLHYMFIDPKVDITGNLSIKSPYMNASELIEVSNSSLAYLEEMMASDSTATEVEVISNEIIKDEPTAKIQGRKDDSQPDSSVGKGSTRGETSEAREAHEATEPRSRKSISQDSTRQRLPLDSAAQAERKLMRKMLQETSSIIFIPKNMNFKFDLNIDTLLYENSVIENVKGKATIEGGILSLDRLTLRAIGAKAVASMQYQNRGYRSANIYIDLKLIDVDINRIGELLPTVDTLIPAMRSVEGKVTFGFKARSTLDQYLNLELKNLKGAIAMEGTDLVLLDSETFTEIASMLKFKNKERNLIDSLSLIVTADSSKIDLLPFTITMDRYSAIIGGTQEVDEDGDYNIRFDYNISIMKSPLPFKAGVDVFGDMNDFDFKITKAKLKNTDFAEQYRLFEMFRDSI